ncbi:691_t:CDS:2, partial [Racocetra fulgida]
ILLDGIQTLPYGHWQIGLYKHLVVSEISSEQAEERAMKAKLYYLKKLRAKKNLNDYIKTIAVKMFSNKETYTLRLENYRKRYADNDLCASLEELYKLYYQIAKEENRESNGNLELNKY